MWLLWRKSRAILGVFGHSHARGVVSVTRWRSRCHSALVSIFLKGRSTGFARVCMLVQLSIPVGSFGNNSGTLEVESMLHGLWWETLMIFYYPLNSRGVFFPECARKPLPGCLRIAL